MLINDPSVLCLLTLNSIFTGFCLRIADDFETSLDDWKPNREDTVMNACVVPEGTYEVCSRTINVQSTGTGYSLSSLLGHSWKA